MKFINSPIDSFKFNGRTFYVKRDDLLSQEFSGNKARKLAYYLEDQVKFQHIDTLLSYGGSQSNLMYSLAMLAKLKQWQFLYYTRPLSAGALDSVSGPSNLAQSLANGMQLIQIKDNFKEFCQNLVISHGKNQLLIKQGGAQIEAEYGLKQLAVEIKQWAQQMQFNDLAIFVASGTGTTAWFLQQHLPLFKVYTTNCVGSLSYLNEQFSTLQDGRQTIYPTILENKKFRFAEPDLRLFDIINQINKHSQIEFDLVYDPIGWYVLLENLTSINQPILYLHCGGINGNPSMLSRYRA